MHGSDLSCSVAMPLANAPSLKQLMTTVGQTLTDAVSTLEIPARSVGEFEATTRIECCLTEASPYAVMVGQRKLCGLAIRRFPRSWLLQGSMLLRPLPAIFERGLPAEFRRIFDARAISLEEAAGRAVAEDEIIEAIIEAWRVAWGLPVAWGQLVRRNQEPIHAV